MYELKLYRGVNVMTMKKDAKLEKGTEFQIDMRHLTNLIRALQIDMRYLTNFNPRTREPKKFAL